LDEVAEGERKECITFWKTALEYTLALIVAPAEGSSEDIPAEVELRDYPPAQDRWVLERSASLILELRSEEEAEALWIPILDRAASAHNYVGVFLTEWFTVGLSNRSKSRPFLEEWQKMLEFAFSSPRWSLDGPLRVWHIEEMWIHIMGLYYFNRTQWTEDHKVYVEAMRDMYKRWADRFLDRGDSFLAFAGFLKQPAGEAIYLDAFVWLADASERLHPTFWKQQSHVDALAYLVERYYRIHWQHLRHREDTASAFRRIVTKLVEYHHPVAFEIQQQMSG
jgi:hypothetical protein